MGTDTAPPLKVGDRVLYRIREGVSLPGTIVNITPRRYVIRLDDHAHNPRNTTRENLIPIPIEK